ncbi:MAG TPA: Fic family protein [Pyrinomonadaceae bacterium]|nr:Fic family protein [Pyrinomonadaceae bacterium]
MVEILQKAEALKAELDSLRPLDAEAEGRIMQKFRLDWNYHSNNLEGNSLTYGETKALILFGITAQGKPLKDHFEITGHNEAINWILELLKDETPLTEKFIRELHTLLLKESSYKEAQTPNGKPTRRKIEVGKYKTQPNHVITETGETFYFATPEETPAKMQELVEWYRKGKEREDVNPIILAALFHYRFIRIHPFDDGNGRVARILMNFILMQFGYPPVIIKTEDKENYYAVLRLADAGELEPFIEYIAQNLVRSLEIMIRGTKGEEIEDLDELNKSIFILNQKAKDLKGNKSIKVFHYIEDIDAFIVTKEFADISDYLGLSEWNHVVWIGRLFARDNDYGEHWFDNWDERERLSDKIESLGITENDLLIIVPENFVDGKNGPCHPPKIRKMFWTDVLKSLHISYELLFAKAKHFNDREKQNQTGFYIKDLEERIAKIQANI